MTMQNVTADAANLTAAGWTLLILCVGFVCGLCAFCFWRLLREPSPARHHHVPLDIDTRDTET